VDEEDEISIKNVALQVSFGKVKRENGR